MTHTTKPISRLRQRILDDVAMLKLNPKPQIAYVRAVRKLAQFLGRSPDLATSEDLRRFQLHLVECGASSTTLNATITGLRFSRLLSSRRIYSPESPLTVSAATFGSERRPSITVIPADVVGIQHPHLSITRKRAVILP